MQMVLGHCLDALCLQVKRHLILATCVASKRASYS